MAGNQESLNREISKLNYDLRAMCQQFQTFKNSFGNKVDKHLIKEMTDTLTILNDMLTNFDVVNVGDTALNFDLANYTIRKTYFCNVCFRDIATNGIAFLGPHLNSKEHKDNFRKHNLPNKNSLRASSINASKENISKGMSNLSLNECGVNKSNAICNSTVFINHGSHINLPRQSTPSPKPHIPPLHKLLVGTPLFKLPCAPNELPGLKENRHSSAPQPPPSVVNTVKNTKPQAEVNQMNAATIELLKQNLDKSVNQFLSEASNVNFSDSLAIKNSLKKTLAPHFTYVDVYPFGSRENGTGTNTTDLDVYVDIDRSYHGVDIENKDIIMERLKKVVDILEAHSDEWGNIREVKARIPIIKILNKIEGIDCDISFTSGLGCCNTELIKYLTNLQPVFRKMIIFLKRWLKCTGLNIYINNYTLILLIMFYLQMKQLLPPIEKLQRDIEPVEIGPWNGGFQQKTSNELKLNRTENAARHIIGFFDFYSAHDLFNNRTLCLYLGQLVSNSNISGGNLASLKRYNDFSQKYKDQPDLLFKFEYMNVQDPFDLANNTAKMVPLNVCRKFVNLANASFELLYK